MSRRTAYSDTDEFSDQGINPDFHVVPSSSQYDPSEQDYEQERRTSHDLLLDDQDDDDLGSTSNKQLIPSSEEEAQPPPPIELHPAVLMIANVLKKLLSPIFKIVFAPQTQRAIIKSLVVVIVVAWILLTSFTAYLTFYQRYIPKTAHVEPIYFQYTQLGTPPQGQVRFTGPNPIMPLRSDQAYDVSVQLHVPTSDINFNLGNFMINVDLLSNNGTVLATSSRPAILRYQSMTQRVLHVLAKAIPLLIGWTEESQYIHVVLIENYIEKKVNPTTQARITLSSSQLQVYDAHISVVADFRGLRYYMYHRRVATAFIFIVLFTTIEVIFASIAWRAFGENLWEKLTSVFEQDIIVEDKEKPVEVEGEQEEEEVEEGEGEGETSQYHTEDDAEYETED